MTLAEIAATRAALWANGYRPIPLLSHTDPDPRRAGKAPIHRDWPERARKNPPEAAVTGALAHLANTGLLCDGLRALDFDIDDSALANDVEGLAIRRLGAAPTRRRTNSDRFLMIYRAAEGEPGKRSITGASHCEARGCKIEVLGRGQQFAAFGTHASGGTLYWSGPEPLDMAFDALPAVTEAQITGFLAEAAALIGAAPPGEARERKLRVINGGRSGEDHDTDEAVAPREDIEDALATDPNNGPPDWDHFNAVGMAVYVASGGADWGRDAFVAWEQKNPGHGATDSAAARWAHYADSPPSQTGPGKLWSMAWRARPGWRRPSELEQQAAGGPGHRRGGNGATRPRPQAAREPQPPERDALEDRFPSTEPGGEDMPEVEIEQEQDAPPAEWNKDVGPEGQTEPPPRTSEDDDFVLPVEFSENALSYLFSARHQHRLVFVHGWGKWLRYDAGRWHEDYTVRVYDAARAICAEQGERARHTLPAKSASKVAAIINKASCVAAIERLARHHEPQTRDLELFNADDGRISGPSRHSKLRSKRRR